MSEDEPTNTDVEAGFDESDVALERAVGRGGITLFQGEIRDEVERLLAAGQAVEPTARSRFIQAARRGARVASAPTRALERLLYEHRIEADLPLDAIATSAGLDSALLRQVERGSEKLTTIGPTATASWIVKVGIPDDVALSALAVSFDTRRPTAAYAAGAQNVETDEATASFIADVKAALEQLRTA